MLTLKPYIIDLNILLSLFLVTLITLGIYTLAMLMLKFEEEDIEFIKGVNIIKEKFKL